MWYVPCWHGIKVVSMLYWVGWVGFVVWCVVIRIWMGCMYYSRLSCVVCSVGMRIGLLVCCIGLGWVCGVVWCVVLGSGWDVCITVG